jgi:hypothetical protein
MAFVKKILTSVISFVIALSIVQIPPIPTSVAEHIESSPLITGGALWPDHEINDVPLLEERNEIPRLSSSVDNSNSIYFPSIGNQGQMNSCIGWGTTYYQYTYEVNRLKGIATTSSNTYSPSWTYNYINAGQNIPTDINDAYAILKNQGALLLNDYPHPVLESQYSYTWSTNIQKMTNALHYRVTPEEVNVVSSSCLGMEMVKGYLEDGRIATIITDPAGWDIRTSTSGESVIIRGANISETGHCMTVVGYDDNVVVNYNGVTFTGAFKLANSWGTENTWPEGNNGFIWVAYDALNGYSNYETQWETGYSTIRGQVFGNANKFYFVTVKYYPCYYVGQVTFYSNDPWDIRIFGDISTSAWTKKFYPYEPFVPCLNNAVLGVIVFDYFTTTEQNVADYINSPFTTMLYNPTPNNTYHIYLALNDCKCKRILPNDTIYGYLDSNVSEYSRTFYISLKKGRISNYDNGDLTLADASLLQSYLLGAESISSLQFYLADMDNDSTVDFFDYILLQQAIAAQNGDLVNRDNILSEYIPELNKTLVEYIRDEYGDEGVAYAKSLLSSEEV